jgi:hypothetical protein
MLKMKRSPWVSAATLLLKPSKLIIQ